MTPEEIQTLDKRKYYLIWFAEQHEDPWPTVIRWEGGPNWITSADWSIKSDDWDQILKIEKIEIPKAMAK